MRHANGDAVDHLDRATATRILIRELANRTVMAEGFIDSDECVDWFKIMIVLPVLSHGEKAIIALAAHLDDRPGVVKDAAPDDATITSLLARVDAEYRELFCDLLTKATASLL